MNNAAIMMRGYIGTKKNKKTRLAVVVHKDYSLHGAGKYTREEYNNNIAVFFFLPKAKTKQRRHCRSNEGI